MNRRGLRRVLGAAFALLALGAGPAPATPHLDLARNAVTTLKPGQTRYQHKTVVEWDASGRPRKILADCSGFVNALFERAYSVDPDGFRRWLGEPRPLAEHYHGAIADGRGFRMIVNVAELKPGDLMAIRYPANAEDTGHVMVIDSEPRRRSPAAPLVAGTEQWEIDVIDSTRVPHVAGDTRQQGKAFRGGVGRGVLRIYTSPDGVMRGYAWRAGGRTVYYPFNVRSLIAGRLEDGFRP